MKIIHDYQSRNHIMETILEFIQIIDDKDAPMDYRYFYLQKKYKKYFSQKEINEGVLGLKLIFFNKILSK